jgi:hypothetical protein
MEWSEHPPGITGTVASVTTDSVRVEATPPVGGGIGVAIVTMTSARLIRWRDGRDAGITDIRAGDVISVWFRGPARESWPVQAEADTVIIEARSP